MASEPTTEPTEERRDDAAAEQATTGETRKKAARKKATKKTADAPGKPAARRSSTRGRRRAADTGESPAETSPGVGESLLDEAEAPVDTDTVDVAEDQQATEQAGEAVALEEVTAQEATDDEGTVEEETAAEGVDEDAAGGQDSAPVVVPSFGLIFQAPEPVAPRRRRATSAAGAPARTEPSEPQGVDADLDAERSETPQRDLEPREEESAAETDNGESGGSRRSRRRGGRGRRTGRSGDGEGDAAAPEDTAPGETEGKDSRKAADRPEDGEEGTAGEAGSRRRRRRRRGADSDSDESRGARARDEVTGLKGSTRLEAKKQRRREGREAGRRRQIITEAEFLARRESVERVMVVREKDSKTQIGVLEDGVLVEHYVSRETGASMIGNVYLGRVQNVLPSMEAAFVDIGKGRNAVLYAGEVNWDAAGLEGNVPKRIENALTSGDTVLVQVTKDPIGHKGARLTSQVSLPGRFLVYVPEASMTGISRKLPDTERARLKSILKKIVPDDAGVIVRTASEGASEEELTADIERLTQAWERIRSKAESAAKKKGAPGAPALLHGEPDLTVKVIRDVFNEDFSQLVVSGERAWADVSEYLGDVAPDLAKRLSKWTSETDIFTSHRVDEQLAKALDRKVWLPSGGSLVIDRTEAMTVVDVNTGKFVGSGGNLEETVTKNNIEAAEEIVRQLRLRDIGGIIVIDFIDMVLEANRDLVVRRLLECLGRDRTKHQVAEVTSLGLVQMTRKRVGSGLLEVFSEPCGHCSGRGVIVHADPVDQPAADESNGGGGRGRGRNRGGNGGTQPSTGRANRTDSAEATRPQPTGPTAAQIAAAAHAAALKAAASVPADAQAADGAPDADTLAVITAEIADAVTVDGPVEPIEPERDGQVSSADVEPAVPTDGSQQTDESHATDASEPTAEPEPEVGETVAEVSEPPAAAAIEPSAPVEAAPATRPRRRRGRVVAQAGPPGRSEVRVLGAESVDADAASAEADG
jgi:ribonuclease E